MALNVLQYARVKYWQIATLVILIAILATLLWSTSLKALLMGIGVTIFTIGVALHSSHKNSLCKREACINVFGVHTEGVTLDAIANHGDIYQESDLMDQVIGARPRVEFTLGIILGLLLVFVGLFL